MLLGTGPDGHCGCLFPDTPEIKATGTGQVVMAGNDARADGDFLAVSMDVMCATKLVIVSAADEGRAEMVAKALSGEFGAYDCPAGMVEAQDETICASSLAGGRSNPRRARPVAPLCRPHALPELPLLTTPSSTFALTS